MVDCHLVHTDEHQFTDLNITLNMSIIQCFGLLTNLCSKTAADVQFAQSFDITIEPGYRNKEHSSVELCMMRICTYCSNNTQYNLVVCHGISSAEGSEQEL